MSKDKMTPFEKAKSLFDAARKTVQTGVFSANAAVVKKRRSICEACPSNRRRGRKCSKCSCNIYVKTLVQNTQCPDGHWGISYNDDEQES